MRILILSNYPWKNNNSFGNTYSSIFKNVPNIEIAHVYMFDGVPDQMPNVTCYYQILERDVIKSVFKRSVSVGKQVFIEHSGQEDSSNKQNEKKQDKRYGSLLSFGKRHHWRIMFWARELAWKFGRINYNGLMDFVEDFKPDIFFLPFSNVFYTNRLALYIKRHYDMPMVMEMAMDHYTLNRVSWNPLFWLDRFAKRRMIRKVASQSEMLFAISKKLKEELEPALHIPCRVLYKTPDINRAVEPYCGCQDTVRFLFTGNIYSNRWKSLALLANELKRQQFGHLDVYTASPITSSIDKALNIEGFSELHPPVSQAEVIELQNKADVLVHTEAFDKYNKSLVRCAISTKIMDYISFGRCILAIGPSDISSIEYLADNKIALLANSKEELSQIVSLIKNDTSVLTKYSKRGLDYSREYLNATKMSKELYDDLQKVIDNYNK